MAGKGQDKRKTPRAPEALDGGPIKAAVDFATLPLDLIRSIAQFRIKENSERSAIKGKKP